MALTSDQILELTTLQAIASTIIAQLDKETAIASENRSANGVSNDNIAALNNTLQNTLAAIDTLVGSAA